MNKPAGEEFYQELRDCIEGRPYRNLIGKTIHAQFLCEELELIDWALKAYNHIFLYEHFAEFMSIPPSTADEARTGLNSELKKVFDRMQEQEAVIKKVCFKIDEALEIAARKEETEPGLEL